MENGPVVLLPLQRSGQRNESKSHEPSLRRGSMRRTNKLGYARSLTRIREKRRTSDVNSRVGKLTTWFFRLHGKTRWFDTSSLDALKNSRKSGRFQPHFSTSVTHVYELSRKSPFAAPRFEASKRGVAKRRKSSLPTLAFLSDVRYITVT